MKNSAVQKEEKINLNFGLRFKMNRENKNLDLEDWNKTICLDCVFLILFPIMGKVEKLRLQKNIWSRGKVLENF